eukprot:6294461-Prymnesium_polylepis.2
MAVCARAIRCARIAPRARRAARAAAPERHCVASTPLCIEADDVCGDAARTTSRLPGQRVRMSWHIGVV